MPDDHRLRRQALRALLADRNADALLVTDLLNVRYLTGFTGSNAALLVTTEDTEDETRTVISTDGRYLSQVAEQVPDLKAEITRAVGTRLIELAAGNGARRVGFESHI